MWSLESSVKARRSCLRIPSSIMKSRAPSLIVSVRSNFCSFFKWLLAPLKKQTRRCEKSHIIVEQDNAKGILRQTVKKGVPRSTYYSLEMQGFCSVSWHFPLQEILGFPVVSTGRDHPWTEPNKWSRENNNREATK